MLVGVPGSGKSTLVARWRQEQAVDLVISSDRIRHHLTGSESDVTHDSTMWPIFYGLLASALEAGLSVALDATNLRREKRRDILNIAGLYGVDHVSAHVMRCTFEEAKWRNYNRPRRVPYDVMMAMWSHYENECAAEQLAREGFAVFEYTDGR